MPTRETVPLSLYDAWLYGKLMIRPAAFPHAAISEGRSWGLVPRPGRNNTAGAGACTRPVIVWMGQATFNGDTP